MAPLKVIAADRQNSHLGLYPWLKGHGSIKGLAQRTGGTGVRVYPWLKGHGSIKGTLFKGVGNMPASRYPWLKGHGSIKGYGNAVIRTPRGLVSMAERSWLH